MTSFDNKKELKFVITLGTGNFGSSSNNTITLQGYRAIVDIDRGGGAMFGQLRASIYGVSQSDMNAITTLKFGPRSSISGIFNTVSVFAIDGTQETQIFQGNIINAWGNYLGMPEVFLMIQAQNILSQLLTPVPPKSYKGNIDVATVMSQLAKQMGLTFENNGVSVQLRNQYLSNTALVQAQTLAKAAGIDIYFDSNGVLAITPPNTARNKPSPILSAQTGMIGYPTFDGIGIHFQALFNPAVIFGGPIQVVSDVARANGTWIVIGCAYRLESEKPGGAWFMTIRGNTSGLAFTSS